MDKKYWVSHSFNVMEDVYLYRILTEGREGIKIDERVWITTEEAVAEQLASVLNQETAQLTAMLDESQHNLVQRNLELVQAKKELAELEAENTVINRKLVLANQYVGYLQAALEEIGNLSSVYLKVARVKKIVARALGGEQS